MYPIFPRAGHRAHPCAPRHSAACRRLLLMALCTLPLWTLPACSTLSALQAAAPEQQAAQAGPNLSLLTLPAYTDTDAAAAQPADAAGQTALVDLWLDGTQNMPLYRQEAYLETVRGLSREIAADTGLPLTENLPAALYASENQADGLYFRSRNEVNARSGYLNMSGGNLRLRFSDTGSKPFVEVYAARLGTPDEISFLLLTDTLPILLYSMLTILFTLLLFAFATLEATRHKKGLRRGYLFLLLFVLQASSWFFTDSDITGILFLGNEAFYLITLANFLLLPLPFLAYTASLQPDTRSITGALGLLMGANFLYAAVLTVIGQLTLWSTLMLTHILLGLMLCVMLWPNFSPRRRQWLDADWQQGTIISSIAMLMNLVVFYVLPFEDNCLPIRMSWESTVTYYQTINERINAALGGYHSGKILLYSVDFAEVEAEQRKEDWTAVGELMADAALRLERGGADFILLGTNTMTTRPVSYYALFE